MRSLNLGILAHVDAGKTSLTERLLHAAGVIDEIGRVDDGTTRTDSLSLERQRGITIKSAVVSFAVDDVVVNLIDTPGHPDFIAEVERVLSVLDGAVLVVSAVEGVQPQTRVLMRTLRRLRLPTLVFVNKIDRRGAQAASLVRTMAAKLAPAMVPMNAASGLGTREATARTYGAADAEFGSALLDALAGHDDTLLAAYVDDAAGISYDRLRAELAAQTRRAEVHPVYFGSAMTGAGVDALTAGVRELLPAAGGDAEGPVSGTVFKVERGAGGEQIAYVRMFSGTVRARDRLPFGPPHAAPTADPERTGGEPAGGEPAGGRAAGGERAGGEPAGGERAGGEGKVIATGLFEHGPDVRSAPVPAGRIGKLWGLPGIRIGDTVGTEHPPSARQQHFAPPTLETVVVPRRPSDRGALHTALTQLAEQDPLIGLRRNDIRQEISLSLYGEVQKEVIQAWLADEFGIGVTFRETTTICLERPDGAGESVEFMVKDKEINPFLATVGLRVEPAPAGTGVEFRLGVELGAMPHAFFRAVEETVHETLHQGLHGWQVTDCRVTMTHSGYAPRQSHSHAVFDKSMSSTGRDFRHLTPLVLMSALTRAGTTVHEPVHRFRLELPADTLGAVLPVLGRLGAVPYAPVVRGTSYVLEGEVPAASVHELEQRLPGLTRGEGEVECVFERHRPVRGPVPVRERWDHDPLDRKGYLLRVVRRVTG
ncbi:translation factor GTPase family protein [Streptomyces sp. NPDC047108]|uniref:translation factor GTPase family protein n=1 Tax=Streptomyces sp. NPDC047108 TaxID=3155025 RepID=UPI0033E77ECB